MRKIALAAVISIWAVAGMAFTTRSVLADDRERLIGTWKLVEAVNEDLSTHEKTDIYKAGALGFITYGADGRMMAIVVNSGRKKPVGDVATGPEAEAAFSHDDRLRGLVYDQGQPDYPPCRRLME